jgi:hypothetical protein
MHAVDRPRAARTETAAMGSRTPRRAPHATPRLDRRRRPRPDGLRRGTSRGRDEVADAVSDLLGAAYVTGVNVDVAGGYRL